MPVLREGDEFNSFPGSSFGNSRFSKLCLAIEDEAELPGKAFPSEELGNEGEKEIDQYIQDHGPMTRPEVIERALTKLFSEVR